MKSLNMKLYISVMVLLTPILDGLYFFNIDYGLFIKTLYILSLIVYCAIMYKGKDYKIFLLLFISMFMYMLLFMYFANDNDLAYEFRGVISLFYFPILLYTYYAIKKINGEFISKDIIIFGTLLYSVIIIVSVLLDIDVSTYEGISSDRIGSKGVFYAPNEVGVIIGLGASIVILSKFNYKYLVYLVIMLISVILLSSKTPLIMIMLSFLYLIIKNIKNVKVLIPTVIVLLMLVVYIPRSSLAYNYSIHTEYLYEKYDVDSVSEIVSDPYIFLNEYVVSGRLDLLDEINDEYIYSSVEDKVMGIGFHPFVRSTEMDFFEIFYRTGIFGFIYYIAIIIYALYLNLNKMDLVNKLYLLSVVLLVSMFVGHVMMSISVSIFLAAYIAYKEELV